MRFLNQPVAVTTKTGGNESLRIEIRN